MSSNDEKTMIDPSGGPSKDGAKMKLGPYETTELLGRGGMAVVYKGTQQSLGRVVAIKVLPKEFSRDRQFVGRFHREAESVAKLNHPNIIQIIDKGEDAGTCYFVMEYVKGMSLAAKLQAKGVTLKELIEIGIQVCSALHFAHEQGVVHRDIKPANILLDDTTGVAKVADFGIAQLAEKSTAIGTLTGDHMAMGTLDYMAPEQKRDAKNVDRRADIYSVGVMLYEMATGRVPMGIFDPPSRINKDVTKDFDVIVMKCLRDKPAERYQTCQELSNALVSLPQNPSTMVRMITSVKSGVTNIGTQIGRRNPRYIAAVMFLVAGLGVGSFAVWKYGLNRAGGNGNSSSNGNSGNGGTTGGTGTNGNGSTTTKPPDDTAAQAAEKAFAKKMKDASDLAEKGDLKAASEAYAALLPDATGSQRLEINEALRDIRERQEMATAEAFRNRLIEARVDPAMATSASVQALQRLLDEANAQKVRQDVIIQITAELERTRTAALDNEQAAADKAHAAKFREAADKAKSAIEAGDLEAAEKALVAVATLAEGAVETEEYGRLTRALEAKRGAAATAEDNRRRFEKFMKEASDAAGRGDFTPARLRLADAEALVGVVGGDAGALLKAAREDVDRREKNAAYARKILEAKNLETTDPHAAAAGYRAAAEIAPSTAEADSARAKAKILEDNAARDAADRLFTEHLEAAKKAKETKDWKKVEAEARAALDVRRGNPEAMALQAEALKEMQAKPPDPKTLAFTFKGAFKGAYKGIESVALDPTGAIYALDKGTRKLFTVATDFTLLRETAIPVKYPDRVLVDSKKRVWMTEWGKLSTINIMDPNTGKIERAIGGYGSENGKFSYLVDIAVSPDGETMYGLDSGNFRLQALSIKDGAFLWKAGTKWSGRGMTDNHFYTAKCLAVDNQGRIYASDSGVKTIQRFKPDGTFDGIFKAFTDGLPGPIAWANNRLYVMDIKLFKLVVYSADGTELGSNLMYGNGDSQVVAPTGMTVGPDGKVYIADRGSKVVVLEEAK